MSSSESARGEEHPSFGMIGAYRTSVSPPGGTLFDSDVRHQHTVVVKVSHAERFRELGRDWHMARKQIIEIEMSEAQWASFVSSMNTSGVPCTLNYIGAERIERPPFRPRLEESMVEVHAAARKAFDDIEEAFAAYEASPTKSNRRTLQACIENATPNVDFAGKQLAEHAENVVTKARADIETYVLQKERQLQLEATQSRPTLELGEGDGDV